MGLVNECANVSALRRLMHVLEDTTMMRVVTTVNVALELVNVHVHKRVQVGLASITALMELKPKGNISYTGSELVVLIVNAYVMFLRANKMKLHILTKE